MSQLSGSGSFTMQPATQATNMNNRGRMLNDG